MESEIFSEPPEPYFTLTAGDFETDKVKSASTESLKSGGSNVCLKIKTIIVIHLHLFALNRNLVFHWKFKHPLMREEGH